MDVTEPQATLPAAAPQHRSEPALRAAIAQTLRAHGLAVDEQVACAAGAADLVTARRDAIYEAKLFLSRKALQQAVGQLMLYRASINPEARLIVVGYPTPETTALRPHIEALGIEVVALGDGAWEMGYGEEGIGYREAVPESASPSPNPQPLSTLRWHLAAFAQSHGLASVREVSFATHVGRQSLYPIWNGIAKSVSVDMLERLCAALEADPGDWFRWEGDRLHWAIQAAAQARGLDLPSLSWSAEILPQSLTPIWRGTQQFVFVETLAKLARALDLRVGNLFEWRAARTEV
ncbi:MAG TPA: helix-turn-helix transcriptional regulator [Roseiflexaceae bacterium]|nr:helix-turn-helix transcriptional regulator [Roseiflexaceae bacterium]